MACSQSGGRAALIGTVCAVTILCAAHRPEHQAAGSPRTSLYRRMERCTAAASGVGGAGSAGRRGSRSCRPDRNYLAPLAPLQHAPSASVSKASPRLAFLRAAGRANKRGMRASTLCLVLALLCAWGLSAEGSTTPNPLGSGNADGQVGVQSVAVIRARIRSPLEQRCAVPIAAAAARTARPCPTTPLAARTPAWFCLVPHAGVSGAGAGRGGGQRGGGAAAAGPARGGGRGAAGRRQPGRCQPNEQLHHL